MTAILCCRRASAIVLSRDPPAVRPRSFDEQAEANATRGPVPALVEDYPGPSSVETYTVFYDRAGAPTFGVVIARAPGGGRFICRAAGDDAQTIAAFLTSGEREPWAFGPSDAGCRRRELVALQMSARV